MGMNGTYCPKCGAAVHSAQDHGFRTYLFDPEVKRTKKSQAFKQRVCIRLRLTNVEIVVEPGLYIPADWEYWTLHDCGE